MTTPITIANSRNSFATSEKRARSAYPLTGTPDVQEQQQEPPNIGCLERSSRSRRGPAAPHALRLPRCTPLPVATMRLVRRAAMLLYAASLCIGVLHLALCHLTCSLLICCLLEEAERERAGDLCSCANASHWHCLVEGCTICGGLVALAISRDVGRVSRGDENS